MVKRGGIILDVNRMTESLQTALFQAQSIAVEHHHQELDEAHLFLALMDLDDSLVAAILEKAGLSAQTFIGELHKLLEEKTPSYREWGRTGKNLYFRYLAKAFRDSGKEMKKFQDEYISVEHILLACLNTEGSKIGKILRKHKVGSEKILATGSKI